MAPDQHDAEVIVEYAHREADGRYWLDVRADRGAWASVGPFDTAAERQRAHDDMLEMMRSSGARDLPVLPQ